MFAWQSKSLLWEAERETARQRDQEIAEELQQVRARLAQLEEELKTARAELDAARDRRGELAAEQARLHSDMQHLSETCVQELSTQREELMSDESVVRIAGEALDRRRRSLQRDAHPPGEYGSGQHDGA